MRMILRITHQLSWRSRIYHLCYHIISKLLKIATQTMRIGQASKITLKEVPLIFGFQKRYDGYFSPLLSWRNGR